MTGRRIGRAGAVEQTRQDYLGRDFKFWIEIAAVLFVMTVGRDAFLQQWLGGSH